QPRLRRATPGREGRPSADLGWSAPALATGDHPIAGNSDRHRVATCDHRGVPGLVFVEAWQIQCCGDPFEVGDSVSWLTVPSDDKLPFLSKKLGARALEITQYEEHHVIDGPTETRVGIVRSIEAAFCMYDRVDGPSFDVRTGSA